MDKQQQSNSSGNESPRQAAAGNASPRDRARRWTIAGLTAATVAAVGAAFAWQGRADAHGGFMGRHGWHEMDPESMGRRLDAMVGWVLADVDATPDQKSRIGAIAKGAIHDLAPLRRQHMEARRRSLELLAAPAIDRAQIERLRVEQLQLADTTTRRLSQALLDAAEVLNPDQRARLIGKWQQRHARRHSGGQG